MTWKDIHIHVWRELHYSNVRRQADLSAGLDPPDAADIEHTPGSYQGQHNPPLQAPGLIDGCRGVQGLSVPEVVNSAAPCTLRHHTCVG